MNNEHSRRSFDGCNNKQSALYTGSQLDQSHASVNDNPGPQIDEMNHHPTYSTIQRQNGDTNLGHQTSASSKLSVSICQSSFSPFVYQDLESPTTKPNSSNQGIRETFKMEFLQLESMPDLPVFEHNMQHIPKVIGGRGSDYEFRPICFFKNELSTAEC